MVGIFLICFLLNGVSFAENLFRESNGIGHRATIQPEGKVDQLNRMNYYLHFVVCVKSVRKFSTRNICYFMMALGKLFLNW